MALMLVIPAVALAAILCNAMLANVGTQDQISSNAELLSQADCLAESGNNYAMYELEQYITNQCVPPSINYPVQTTKVGNLQESFCVTAQSTLLNLNTVKSTITSTSTIANLGSQNSPVITRKMVLIVQIPLVPPSGPSSGGTPPPWFYSGNPTSTGNPTSINGSGASGASLLVPQKIQVINWSQN